MMQKLLFASLTLLLIYGSVLGQQTPSQTLTVYYDYTVNPGKEADFMDLIKTVGAPVRDKLMAEGVVLAWGMETPILRYPGAPTHTIWVGVANWDGVGKLQSAMEAQLAKLAAEEARSPQKGKTTAERAREVFDTNKTRDWLTRDLVSGFGQQPPADGVLPVTRYNAIKVKPGKNAAYRSAWEKYNKPVFDKLVADGVVLAYGLSLEEIKTEGDFTYFVWMATANMAGMEKIRDAFTADRAKRTQDERNQITEAFLDSTEPDKARSVVTQSRIFRLPK